MITPSWLLSTIVVVLAARGVLTQQPVGGGAEHDRTDPSGPTRQAARLTLTVGAATSAGLAIVVASAGWLEDVAQVTAPTVRLAAAVAVGVTAGSELFGVRRPLTITGRRTSMAVLAGALNGAMRVEVAVAVWALTLDHGRGAGLLTVAALLGLAVVAAATPLRPWQFVVAPMAAVAALAAATALGVNAVLAL